MIMVITQDKTWFLCAESQREAEEWAQKLCETLEAAAKGANIHGKNHLGRRRRLSSHVTAATIKEIQSRDQATRIDEFLEIYFRSTAEDIRIQASRGAFSWSCMRNISWRLWLGTLPVNLSFQSWIDATRTSRLRYEELNTRFKIDSAEMEAYFEVTPLRQFILTFTTNVNACHT